jgi:hypothetical protein
MDPANVGLESDFCGGLLGFCIKPSLSPSTRLLSRISKKHSSIDECKLAQAIARIGEFSK